MEFSHYDQCPKNIADEVIAKAKWKSRSIIIYQDELNEPEDQNKIKVLRPQLG